MHATNASENAPEAVVKSAEGHTNGGVKEGGTDVSFNQSNKNSTDFNSMQPSHSKPSELPKASTRHPHALLRAICARLQHDRS